MLTQQLGMPVELLRTTIVGPQVGAELFQQGMLAVLVASLAMSAYLAFRFEWRQAIGILLSVVHDAIVALGLLSLFQIEFDLNIIAGLMAVIGYSLNDSIVISDRLRDLLSSRTQMGIHECSDVAIKATFSRTMITSGTTLFTVGALLLFGGDALYGFSFTLFAGILVGTVSSITVASTVQELLGLTPPGIPEEERRATGQRSLNLVNQARLTRPQRTGPLPTIGRGFFHPSSRSLAAPFGTRLASIDN